MSKKSDLRLFGRLVNAIWELKRQIANDILICQKKGLLEREDIFDFHGHYYKVKKSVVNKLSSDAVDYLQEFFFSYFSGKDAMKFYKKVFRSKQALEEYLWGVLHGGFGSLC
jgi:hypothetical protein